MKNLLEGPVIKFDAVEESINLEKNQSTSSNLKKRKKEIKIKNFLKIQIQNL